MTDFMTFGLTCSNCGHSETHINADHPELQYATPTEFVASKRAAGWQAPDQPHTKPVLCPACLKKVGLQQTQ